MDPHQPFSKVFFYEYSFSIISNFLDNNKPVTAEAGVIENVRTKCIIIYCGSSPLLDDSSVSSTTKTRCYQAAVNNGIVRWETPQNDNIFFRISAINSRFSEWVVRPSKRSRSFSSNALFAANSKGSYDPTLSSSSP